MAERASNSKARSTLVRGKHGLLKREEGTVEVVFGCGNIERPWPFFSPKVLDVLSVFLTMTSRSVKQRKMAKKVIHWWMKIAMVQFQMKPWKKIKWKMSMKRVRNGFGFFTYWIVEQEITSMNV